MITKSKEMEATTEASYQQRIEELEKQIKMLEHLNFNYVGLLKMMFPLANKDFLSRQDCQTLVTCNNLYIEFIGLEDDSNEGNEV